MNEEERRLAELASRRFGVVTRSEALALGMSLRTVQRRASDGVWEELFPRVYRLPGTPRTGRQLAMAATLWGGGGAAISHTTAGRLLRLDGVRAEALHLTVPRSGRRSDAAVLHRVIELPRIDRTTVDGIPCTSATRTVIDCAECLGAEALEVAFESARRMGLTSTRALAQRADALCRRGKPGSAAIKTLLAHQRERDPALQYRLEVKTSRLLRAHKLPTPVRQFAIGKYRIDLAYPLQRVGLECEGFEYHGNRLTWKRDKRRTAWIEAQDWRLLFLTWDDVTNRPDETIERIRLALA
jgi:very-short-patch-repair endonuclease